MGFYMVEHVAAEIEVFGDAEVFQDRIDIDAVVIEQQTIPALQAEACQVQAGCLAEMRRADQLAFEVIGPAAQRADNV